jgi:tetratricopeptide (TPR) repeat protein
VHAVDGRPGVIESEGGLRHLAYFEELGKMDQADPSWRSVSAGLVVMRLVDSWIASGSSAARLDAWGVSAVREAIAEVPGTTPARPVLTAIVDVVVSSANLDLHGLIPRLMAYGQTLEYEARWSLAADVYQTIVAHAQPEEDADLVVSAFIQLAFTLRTVSDYDGAAVAYERASSVALAAGDLIGVLRGRLGDAKLAMARGNVPRAESILEETIQCAKSNGLDDIRSRALNDRAYVAGVTKQHDRAIRYSYEALELTKNPRDRDRVLLNIATGFRYLGLLDVARDAYLVLAATGQEQYLRWLSEINLMELAAQQRIELQFDRHRRDLESAAFTPLLRVTYLLHVGRGYHSLGNPEAGIPYLKQAVALAESHKLNQLIFEAEDALADARRKEVRRPAETQVTTHVAVQAVADAIHDLRHLAGV